MNNNNKRQGFTAAPGIDLEQFRKLSRDMRKFIDNWDTISIDEFAHFSMRLDEMIDASPKGGSEAHAVLDALISLVAVARRYLPDYDEHPEIQKADDAIDAAMQAQASDAEVPND